jgi:phospholipid/cholesterol/gamma-HCH transport system substrate-binding protein
MMRKSALLALVATASLTLSGCGFHGLYGVSLPGGANLGSHPYKIVVCFADVLDLVPQSAVKVNDVAIGRVDAVSLTTAKDKCGSPALVGWAAKVTVSVNGDVHLPTNARAAVEQTSLLGEKYVALEQPLDTPSPADLGNGSTIALSHTTTAPEVEEVLGALSLLLNGGGLPEIKVITTELSAALKGNESKVRDLLNQLNSFVGQLDLQKSEIVNTLDSLNRLAATLAAQTTTIDATLDTLPKALQILKDDRTKLVTLLSSLSHLGSVASGVIDATQDELTTALKNLSPALEQLTAAGSDLPKALKVAGTFPFPLGNSLQAVRGDYANLHLFLDLNLVDELCGVGISKSLCDALSNAQSSTGSSSSSGTGSTIADTTTGTTTGTATGTATGTQSADSLPSDIVMEPTLLGLGG